LTYITDKPTLPRLRELALSATLLGRVFGCIRIHTTEEIAARLRSAGLGCELITRPYQPAHPWSLHKIRTYAIEAEIGPFLHVDNDVFIHKQLPQAILRAPVVAQSFERSNQYSLEGLPYSWIAEFIPKRGEWQAFNMGIFGGTDTDAILVYAKVAMLAAAQCPSAEPNVVEQAIMGKVMQKMAAPVTALFKDDAPDGYTHLMQAKDDRETLERVLWRLWYENPRAFDAFSHEDPSVPHGPLLKQRGWKAGYFETDPRPGEVHSNPGYVGYVGIGGDWLSVRVNEGENTRIEMHHVNHRRVTMRKFQLNAGPLNLEDARFVFWINRFWMLATRWPKSRMDFQRCHLLTFDRDFKLLSDVRPTIENNHLDHGPQQKNWTLFFHQCHIHIESRVKPHNVAVVVGPEGTILRRYSSPWDAPEWVYGSMSGGTPPKLVDGLFWTFFHSYLPQSVPTRRRYYVGAMAFEPNPPFRVVKYTPVPILTGTRVETAAHPGSLVVVFPVGSGIDDTQTWMVTSGINDSVCGYHLIPHAELVALCKPVSNEVKADPGGPGVVPAIPTLSVAGC